MNRDIPTRARPAVRPSGSPAGRPEPRYRLPDQRHWIKVFVTGLLLVAFGSLEFLAGKPEISNIFNDPVFAAYWVMAGIPTILVGLILRTWGSR